MTSLHLETLVLSDSLPDPGLSGVSPRLQAGRWLSRE